MNMFVVVGAVAAGCLAFVAAYMVLDPGTARLIGMGMGNLRRLGSVWSRAGPAAGGPMRAGDKAQQAAIMQEMPAFLHILTLGLSAGLSFDASVELYCKRCQTTLARSLWDALLQWRMGVCSRSEALDRMAQELEVPALTRFVATVTEALSFGAPLAHTLERQAKVISDEQRALVETQIERVPVKMLIPLGTLIVPAMLLAILGPLLAPALGMG